MIVVDASAVPDFPSGVRTRLRGLYRAYGALEDAPEVVIRISRGSKLFDDVDLGRVRVEQVESSGGPVRRFFRGLARPGNRGPLLWHSETIPPLAPRGAIRWLTLHDVRWFQPRAETGRPLREYLPRNLVARFWLPRLARSIDRVVTVSDASAEAICRELSLQPAKVSVVPNAAAQPPEQDAVQSSPPYFLCVGPLDPRKRLELALDALAGLGSGGIETRLIIAGQGQAGEALKQHAEKIGVADRVEWPGRVSDADLLRLYQGATALLFPSAIEGFGFPVYEALAAGCPALVQEAEVYAKLDPEAVLRLPPSAPAWAAKMRELLSTASSVRQAVEREREKLSGTTWESSARGLAAQYRGAFAEVLT